MSKAPLECRRGRTIPARGAAQPAGAAWRLTTTAAVLPRARVEQLARSRALPDPSELLLVRVRPGEVESCTVTLRLGDASRELTFGVTPARLDDEGAFGVTLAFVAGAVDGLALPGVTLVDASGSSRVEVSGAGCGPLPLDLEAAAPVQKGELHVAVTDERGSPLDAADVSIAGAEERTGEADDGGLVRFVDLAPGTYELTAAQEGFTSRRLRVEVLAGGGARQAIETSAASRASLVEGEEAPPAPASGGQTTRVQLVAAPCRTSRARIKDLLETPARALSLWQAAHVVAHLHAEGKITLKSSPAPPATCEQFGEAWPARGSYAERFAVSIGGDVQGEGGKSVSFRYIAALKSKAGAPIGWRFVPHDILHVDVRLVVFVYHLVTWLTRTTYEGRHVLSVIHIGFNGRTGDRNDRTNDREGVTWSALNDAHWGGRALDFGGVLLGDEGGAPMTEWRWADKAAEEPVVINDHWGSAPALAGPGYRLQAKRAGGAGIDKARAEVLHDAMKMCLRHTTLDNGGYGARAPCYDPTWLADAQLDGAVDAYIARQSGALLHPDCQAGQRAAHVNHIHLQLGPTRYEFVTQAAAARDLAGTQDPRAPAAVDTRKKEHEAHMGGVGVVKDVGKPPPNDNPGQP